MLENNFILDVDSYKHSHHLQTPPNTEYMYAYIESRGGADRIMFFGLQAFLKQYMSKPITHEDIDEAKPFIEMHGLPFNEAGWRSIVNDHKGILPLHIKSVPEGTVMPTGLPLVTIMNTVPYFGWLVSFVETALLRGVWYPTSVATVSFEIKALIRKYLLETGDVNLLPFKLHDFGSRGASSKETAAIGGLAHMANFQGTDTLSCLVAARRFYNTEMAGFSIPASEHSTITSWGRDNEAMAYANMVKQFAGAGRIYACVSDSYDIDVAVTQHWGGTLRDLVRSSGGTLVVRPDSGEPHKIVLKVVQALWDTFGGTINDKGFKVLDPCVRVIQGDGVNYLSINTILLTLAAHHFSADNVAFGMGGALLQGVTRDTYRFAQKVSAARINGVWIDVFKDPITDSGKRSKKGRIETVQMFDGSWTYIDVRKQLLEGGDFVMTSAYNNGKIRDISLLEVRSRSETFL